MTIIFICSTSFYFLNKKRYKILFIGLDGASWKIILPLIEEDKLPNIKQLMDNGCWGTLGLTTIPAISEVVWTTIATGKPPDIHGITDRLMKDPDTNEMVPPTSNLRRVKAIWNILSAHRKKVGVVGYRVSWPAEKVNGIMISNRLSKEAYFSSLHAQPPLSSFCTRKMLKNFSINSFSPRLRKDTAWVFDRLDNFMANIAEYLYRNNTSDFFCLYLGGIDVVSHYYWKYMFPDNEDLLPEEISRYKDVIPSYYNWCDSVIGRLLRRSDNNTTVIIISDHGFMNRDLQERQYIFSKVDALLEAAGVKKFNHNSKEVRLLNASQEEKLWDFEKNIRIVGDISEEEFNVVRENVKNFLRDIKIKENGNYLFRILDDTQSGFIFEMDGLCTKHKEYHILIGEKEYELLDFLTKNTDSGGHDVDDAIIIMSGENIRQHTKIKDASVYDITPTMLYLLDLPVAKDMQGNVLTSIIDLKLLKKKPVRYIDTYENVKTEGPPKPIRSPADEKVIKERLRSLGYIE